MTAEDAAPTISLANENASSGDGGDGGSGFAIAFLFLVTITIAVVWSFVSDKESKTLCESHGERYIDGKISYTLCERKDGTVVKR